ncbi:hypothetical protein BV25DRAFT_726466 [Artomyces pyxidatus]|uniref:Uncharacterized protein n=1 Tax=Artomyces pyxidatus TaxID=48021 RepID=A0ACB8SYX2_9AGAM|nr:hypothetical protein BV25DRAFT_726466 [Artomyces pyxidatus]
MRAPRSRLSWLPVEAIRSASSSLLIFTSEHVAARTAQQMSPSHLFWHSRPACRQAPVLMTWYRDNLRQAQPAKPPPSQLSSSPNSVAVPPIPHDTPATAVPFRGIPIVGPSGLF